MSDNDKRRQVKYDKLSSAMLSFTTGCVNLSLKRLIVVLASTARSFNQQLLVV